MNTTALGYLLEHLLFHIVEFLRHWYVKSAKIYWDFVMDRFSSLDYALAWRITLQNIFEPLYGDYTFIGHILGFIFRTLRLLVALFLYAILFLCALIAYGLWLFVPIYAFLKIITL